MQLVLVVVAWIWAFTWFIRDYKNGIKKGLIDGVINPRDIPPMYYEGFEFGKKLYRDILDHCEKEGIKITKPKKERVV
jgi:hypothetical protein